MRSSKYFNATFNFSKSPMLLESPPFIIISQAEIQPEDKSSIILASWTIDYKG